ncbi:MAG: hypothetical protein FWH36_00415, partial [Lentimicrobiaceae bacterium]|nr:hypothetical protein [Lentimicrobiaceae bacterium]
LVELSRYQDDMLVKRKQIFDAYSAAFAKETWAELRGNRTEERYFFAFLSIFDCTFCKDTLSFNYESH